MSTTHERLSLTESLQLARAKGRKLLVPYVTGGLGSAWTDVIEAVAAAGADAVEVGIPFSDPVMDGATIQEASERSLRAGATPLSILGALRHADITVPTVVMTYLNIVFRAGYERAATWFVEAGVSGAIVPDLPLEEASPWKRAAAAVGLETVLLVGPTTPDTDLGAICEASRGFIYAVGLMGVTGERSEVAQSAIEIARRCKAVTDLPVLVGVGVSTPDQATRICAVADGVIVGSALVRKLLDGASPEAAGEFIGSFRQALS